MARGKPIGPNDADQACRLTAEGKTINEIAAILKLSRSGLERALRETWPEEYADAQQRRNDILRNEIWKMRKSTDATTQRWAYDHMVKWWLPEARETQRVELNASGEVRFVIESAFQHEITAAPEDVIEEGELDDGDEDPPALPSKSETT